MLLRISVVLTSLVSAPVFAQTMYKCGNTFSQTPCAADAQKIEVKPSTAVDCSNYQHIGTEACRGKGSSSNIIKEIDAARAKVQQQIDSMPPTLPPSAEVIEANKKRCISRIRAMLKDPESARIGEITRSAGPAPDYQTNLGWFPSITYTVTINAKNSYGGYTGAKTWGCSFDLQEKEIIKARSYE